LVWLHRSDEALWVKDMHKVNKGVAPATIKMDKESNILAFLEVAGRASTARIAAFIKANQWAAERHLDQLMGKGRVRQIKETRATYWELL